MPTEPHPSVQPRTPVQDVVVAGGGVAGLALAAAVRAASPGATVTLVEPEADEAARSLRAVAVAPDARRLLARLGAWDAVAPRAQPILEMRITDSRGDDQPRPTYLGFANEADAGEPLAHMAFQEDLRAALTVRCRALGVAFKAGRVTAVHEGGRTAVVETGGGTPLRTRLAVAADGGRSRLREAAGIGTVGWDYPQAGIVATLAHDEPHRGRATQHFLPSGPLAILPLRADDGSERRFSLVWTTGTEEARRLAASPREVFAAALQEVIGHDLGPLRCEDTPTALPLRLTLARRLFAGRLALLGDAARVIHPLAGQGLNLGLRDAAALAEVMGERLALGLDPGDAETLATYERRRRFDGVAMALATDGLNRLFSNDSLPARLIRDLGLGIVDRMPMLKERLILEAAGGGG